MVTVNANLISPTYLVLQNVKGFRRVRASRINLFGQEAEKGLSHAVPYWSTDKIPGKVSRRLY